MENRQKIKAENENESESRNQSANGKIRVNQKRIHIE